MTKMIRVGLSAVLALAVGMAVPAAAQHHDDDHHHGDEHHGNDWNHHNPRAEHGGHYVRYDAHATAHHRIPEQHFRAHFGRDHWFRIGRPTVVAGHPRFQYDGYWFGFAQPLPPGWNYNDEVYVDNVDNNYFLVSPVHPGIRIAINIL